MDDVHKASILILDVDGVLNTAQMPGKHALHPKLLRRLKALVVATSCRIVLSTTWRLQECNVRVLLNALEGAGVSSDTVVGQTPSLGVEELRRRCRGGNRDTLGETRRALEIIDFLDANPHLEAPGGAFAIVDDIDVLAVDDDAARSRLQGHFVRTEVESGLTERCCERLIECLMRR